MRRWTLAALVFLLASVVGCPGSAQTPPDCVLAPGTGPMRCADAGATSGMLQGAMRQQCRMANARVSITRQRMESYTGDLRTAMQRALAQADHDRDLACSGRNSGTYLSPQPSQGFLGQSATDQIVSGEGASNPTSQQHVVTERDLLSSCSSRVLDGVRIWSNSLARWKTCLALSASRLK